MPSSHPGQLSQLDQVGGLPHENVGSVVQVPLRTIGVPYVQVSTAQLGVACLLGLRLLTVQGTCGRKRLYTHVVRVEYLVWKSHSALAGDVGANIGATWLPLDQRSKQR